MNEVPLSRVSYGHALSFFFSRRVKPSHPVETPQKKKSCVSLVHSQALSSWWEVCSTLYNMVLVPSGHPDRGLARPCRDFQPAACLSILPAEARM